MDRARTTMGLLLRTCALLFVVTVFAASCGGSSDDAGDSASDNDVDAAQSSADDAEPEDSTPEGPQRGGELSVTRGIFHEGWIPMLRWNLVPSNTSST